MILTMWTNEHLIKAYNTSTKQGWYLVSVLIFKCKLIATKLNKSGDDGVRVRIKEKTIILIKLIRKKEQCMDNVPESC